MFSNLRSATNRKLTSYEFHERPVTCGCVTFELHPDPHPITDLFSSASRRQSNHILDKLITDARYSCRRRLSRDCGQPMAAGAPSLLTSRNSVVSLVTK